PSGEESPRQFLVGHRGYRRGARVGTNVPFFECTGSGMSLPRSGCTPQPGVAPAPRGQGGTRGCCPYPEGVAQGPTVVQPLRGSPGVPIRPLSRGALARPRALECNRFAVKRALPTGWPNRRFVDSALGVFFPHLHHTPQARGEPSYVVRG